MYYSCYFFFKQKTAYEMRISDWSSDVCSSDLRILYLELPAKRRGKLTDEAQPEPEAKRGRFKARGKARRRRVVKRLGVPSGKRGWTREENPDRIALAGTDAIGQPVPRPRRANDGREQPADDRSEEHTSELQSLMRISYAVFCLKKKKNNHNEPSH